MNSVRFNMALVGTLRTVVSICAIFACLSCSPGNNAGRGGDDSLDWGKEGVEVFDSEGDTLDPGPQGDLIETCGSCDMATQEQGGPLDVNGNEDDGGEESSEIVATCTEEDLTLSVALCDLGFLNCEAIDELESAFLRGATAIQATLSCDPPGFHRLVLHMSGDVEDGEPLSAQCDNALSCELTASIGTFAFIDNITLSAKAIWGDGLNQSTIWERELPAYACPLDPEQAFCLRFGEWEEREIPDLPPTNPVEYRMGGISNGPNERLCFLRFFEGIHDGEASQGAALDCLEDGLWTQNVFMDGQSVEESVFFEFLSHGYLQGFRATLTGFELFILGSPVSADGGNPSSLFAYDGETLELNNIALIS
jgi:hypothetical protein